MKTVLLLSLFVAASFGWDYLFPYCYSATGYQCSTTEPLAGAWTSETYCPNKGIWMNAPCSTYSSLYAANAGDIGCSGGYIWVENPSRIAGGGQCVPKREAAEDIIEERTTYAECPVEGDPYHKVCCPSPKTCHTNTDYNLVCY